jgi:cyclophilin family peptidyl-prolyl cis-trans isomerase
MKPWLMVLAVAAVAATVRLKPDTTYRMWNPSMLGPTAWNEPVVSPAASRLDGPGPASRVVPGFNALALLADAVSGFSRTVSAQARPMQAVVDTSAGTFIIDLDPAAAPATVAYIVKQAQAGAYDGTIFHRMVKYGMVQGGDPLTKDPAKRAQYGTGGLNAVKAEARAAKMTRGSAAAVLVPGRPDSAGSQFFVVIVDQPALDGQYTVFGHVAEGMEVLQKISETPVDDQGVATERVEIRHVVIRETPPPVPEPFSTESAAELAAYRAVLETSAGPITIEVFPDKAPVHVRQFLRLAQAGVYDGMAFHRIAPGFVIQTGALSSRAAPLTPKQQELVHPLQPEFNDTRHVKGTVSMARGDDPGSATTSFFICTAPSTALDGQYTAFGRVVDGMAAVDAIESSPRNGETPITRIDLRTVKVIRQER